MRAIIILSTASVLLACHGAAAAGAAAANVPKAIATACAENYRSYGTAAVQGCERRLTAEAQARLQETLDRAARQDAVKINLYGTTDAKQIAHIQATDNRIIQRCFHKKRAAYLACARANDPDHAEKDIWTEGAEEAATGTSSLMPLR